MTLEQQYKTRLTIAALIVAMLALLILSFLHITQFVGTRAENDNVLVLTSAELLPRDIGITEALNEGNNWSVVDFPFHWRNQYPQTHAVWYRLEFTRAQLQSLIADSVDTREQLWGMYIWRLNQTADIWLNGSKIGSGGNSGGTESGTSMARHWNSPLYFSVPPGLLQDTNTIYIKHFAEHSWGSMEPVVLGDERYLRPVYETRYFIQNDISLGLFVFVLSTGLFTFMVWVTRREETEYLWFSITSAGFSVFCLNQFIRYLPVEPDLWRWLANVTTDLWAVSLVIFLLRSLRLHRPKLEKIALAYLASGVVVYFYASFFQVFALNVYFHLGSLLLGIYSFNLCVQLYSQTRRALPLFYAGVIALLFVSGTHDTAMQAIVNIGELELAGNNFQNHFNFVHFSAPIMFLFIAASLIKRFIDSMNEARRLNRELETRINLAKQELAENYQALQDTLVYKTASEERERIYRDLHDDVGSKLLSLYYRLDNKSDSILAKSALEDLRDIVSRKSLKSYSLKTAVQEWQNEAQERVRDASIPLTWHFDNGEPEVTLSEQQHAHLRRMLREVLSNAILHGTGVSEIRVSITARDGELKISVANDGVQVPAAQWKHGRGLSNLRVRSRDLSGKFAVSDLGNSWVELFWTIPLQSTQGTTT